MLCMQEAQDGSQHCTVPSITGCGPKTKLKKQKAFTGSLNNECTNETFVFICLRLGEGPNPVVIRGNFWLSDRDTMQYQESNPGPCMQTLLQPVKQPWNLLLNWSDFSLSALIPVSNSNNFSFPLCYPLTVLSWNHFLLPNLNTLDFQILSKGKKRRSEAQILVVIEVHTMLPTLVVWWERREIQNAVMVTRICSSW